MPDLTKLQFYSGNNYLKRSDAWGQVSANIGAANSMTTTTIAHDLGYIPQFVLAVDYNNDGIWWSNEYCTSDRSPGGSSSAAITVNPMVDNTNLYLLCQPDGNGLITNTTRPVKYGVYLDSQ